MSKHFAVEEITTILQVQVKTEIEWHSSITLKVLKQIIVLIDVEFLLDPAGTCPSKQECWHSSL